MTKPLRPYLPDELANTLKERILSGRLAPGSRLIQEDLAREFGVSRTPVREAIRHLHALGLVVANPKRGAIVRPIDRQEASDIYQVRAELEGMAARLAAGNLADAALETLRGAEQEYENILAGKVIDIALLGDLSDVFDRWNAANQRFHATLIEASGNQALVQVIDYAQRSFPRNLGWLTLNLSDQARKDAISEHQAIFEAIDARNPKRAGEAMRAHVLRAGERFDRWLVLSTGRSAVGSI